LHPSFDSTGCTSVTKLTGFSAAKPATLTGTWALCPASTTAMLPPPSAVGRTSPAGLTATTFGAVIRAIRVASIVSPVSSVAVTSNCAYVNGPPSSTFAGWAVSLVTFAPSGSVSCANAAGADATRRTAAAYRSSFMGEVLAGCA
jgi:hypothetical protein